MGRLDVRQMILLAVFGLSFVILLALLLRSTEIIHIAGPPPEWETGDWQPPPFPEDRMTLFGLPSYPEVMAFDREIVASAADIDAGSYPSRWQPVAIYYIRPEAELEHVTSMGEPHWVLNTPAASGLSAWDVHSGRAGEYVQVVYEFE